MKCLDVLLPVITKIIKISPETGCFPNDWKEAIVLPILKKAGLESAFENLRPISNLAYISKLIERAVYNQTHAHLLRWNYYPVLQSAYRQYHSTAANPRYIEVYNTLFSGLGKLNYDTGNDISRKEFPNGYAMYTFDLTPDMCGSSLHFNVVQRGNLAIDIKFSQCNSRSESRLLR